MRLMFTWALKPQHQREAVARFLETGGAPPAGVKMLGRWHGSGKGFVLAESDDIKAVFEWTNQWADLLEFEITPVMVDEEAGEVMRRLG
jgi:Domain of unknown function (DUF3303)